MRASNSLHAPSTSLLRFLRCQLDAQAPATARNAIRPRLPLSRQCRALNTTSACRAVPTSQPDRFSNHDRQHTHSRDFSTSSLRQAFWQHLRFTKSSKAPAARPLQQDDLPPLQGFLDDHAGLNGGRVVKPGYDGRLRCTEYDENGKITLVDTEFKKSELIAKYSLLPRDLRKIDSSVLPHILVRPSAILINLLHLRCLIKYNRVLIFDVYGSTDSYAQSLFMYDLEEKLRQKQSSTAAIQGGNLPYEFRALEAVLVSITGALETEFESVREPVRTVLRQLEEDIDREKLTHLLRYSKKLGTFEQKARLVRDAIDDLLEADDDLADMYLTEKSQGREREEDNHEEVELLLESYHKVTDEIVQISSNLISAIRNTEEISRAILDANRNSLMLLGLKVDIGTMGISVGMFIAALYGMNLENFIEESNYGFFGISGFCTVLSIIACMYGLRTLRKVQRLRGWGREHSTGRSKISGPRRELLEERQPVSGLADLEMKQRHLGDAVEGIRKADRMREWKESVNALRDTKRDAKIAQSAATATGKR
ncbi:magnesium ion transporter [Elasticomyces elasticus]|nr:magnesium ion transporter [Elasticomyces elasticus]KAK3639787.1 magnesium ion transporter [Elasticomyces elasticus]KAK4913485.1 magnesium ion transporter [Elasticomyces elasticus]KAK5750925.1 magnesium ion transporter [Elasticomyces elasticus]